MAAFSNQRNVYNDSELQTDTNLILCIEDHDNENDSTSIDNRLFIGWVEEDNDYYVRGKRQDTDKTKYVPYAFHCSSPYDLFNFIKFAVGSDSMSIILYNYNNIDALKDTELTYEFLENNMDHKYEIAAYDDVKMKRSTIVQMLQMIKNAYNWHYSEETSIPS
jgi:hypothetical protein